MHDAPSSPHEPVFSFGAFQYHPGTRTLETDRDESVLPPRVGAALEAFLRRPGVTLSKEELIDEIWLGGWVSDTALTEAMSLLRQALDDDPRHPAFIQTVRGRGYRFLLPVRQTEVEPARPADGAPHARRRRRRVAALGLTALLAGAAAVALLRSRPDPPAEPAQPAVRFSVPLPSTTALPGLARLVAISPDGRRIVTAGREPDGRSMLWSRKIDGLELAPLPGTDGGLGPFFSPDGRWLAFFRGLSLLRTPAEGGDPQSIAEGGFWRGGAWLEDGTLILGGTGRGGLGEVPAQGGAVETLTEIDTERGEIGHWWPASLPDEETILFTVVGGSKGRSAVAALDRATGTWRTILDDAWCARFLPPERLLFMRGRSLMSVRFDPDSGRVVGTPRSAGQDVAGVPGASAQFDVSRTGTLVYLPGPLTTGEAELVRVENGEPAGRVVDETRPFEYMDVHPASGRIAVVVGGNDSTDLWLVEQGELERLTFRGTNVMPLWSADGGSLFFASDRRGSFDLFRKAADGASEAELVLSSSSHLFPLSASADGERLVYGLTAPETGWDLWSLDLSGPSPKRSRLRVTADDELQATVAPDGRWLAYVSTETGRREVFVESLDGAGGRWQVTMGGGGLPFWAPGSDALYAKTPRGVLEVPVLQGRPFRSGRNRIVLDHSDRWGLVRATPTRGRFVAIRRVEPVAPEPDLRVIVHWRPDEAPGP